ncbi:murein biosynthesis integral membrane protein MurJ, partial [Candidatus Uhrbacteria bacterium]|nr:murein biosynthesis integral membrane protein MurJ [Candidatus Uhrbacteria bacterium]
SLDAYYAAFRLPDFLYNLIILGALSAGFIPVFTEYLEKKGKGEAQKLAEQVVSLVFVVMTALALVLIVLAPTLVPWTTPGYEGEKLDLTITLSRIMFLSPILLGLSGVMGGVLQSMRRFLPFALAPIFYNIGIILGALVLTPRFGLQGLAWGVVMGALFHLLIQTSVAGIRNLHWPSLKPDGVRQILKLMGPRTLGLAMTQINLVILLALASSLPEGSVSVFNLATNLQSFPIGIIGVSFAIAAFPALSRAVSQVNTQAFRDSFSHAARNSIFFLVPISALFLLFRAQIVRLLFGAGAFDWTATRLTANVFAWFTLSLVMQGLIPLLARGFYALKDTWTPLWIGLINEVILAVSAYVLRNYLGVEGLAIAFTIASTVQMILLFIWLNRRQRALDLKNIIYSTFKIILATLALGLVAYPLRQWIGTMYPLVKAWQVILQAVVGGMGGVLAFLLVAWLLKSQELTEFLRGFKKRFEKH